MHDRDYTSRITLSDRYVRRLPLLIPNIRGKEFFEARKILIVGGRSGNSHAVPCVKLLATQSPSDFGISQEVQKLCEGTAAENQRCLVQCHHLITPSIHGHGSLPTSPDSKPAQRVWYSTAQPHSVKSKLPRIVAHDAHVGSCGLLWICCGTDVNWLV